MAQSFRFQFLFDVLDGKVLACPSEFECAFKFAEAFHQQAPGWLQISIT
jgi:hypothetical protein